MGSSTDALSRWWTDPARRLRLTTAFIVIVLLGIALDLPGFRGALTLLGNAKEAIDPTGTTYIVVRDDRIEAPATAPRGQQYVSVANRSRDFIRIEYRDLPDDADAAGLVGSTSALAPKRIVLPPLDPNEDWAGAVNDLRPGRYAILAVRIAADGSLSVPRGAVSQFEVRRQFSPSSANPPVITTTTLVEERVAPSGLVLSTRSFEGHVDLIQVNEATQPIRVAEVRLGEGVDPASFTGRTVSRTELAGYGPEVAPNHRSKLAVFDGFFAPGTYVVIAGPNSGEDLAVPAGVFAVITVR